MHGVVGGLTRAGLVEQAPEAAEGRRAPLRLTATGSSALGAAHPVVAAVEDRLLQGMGPDDVEALGRLLGTGLGNLTT